jgi:hypothetical protein
MTRPRRWSARLRESGSTRASTGKQRTRYPAGGLSRSHGQVRLAGSGRAQPGPDCDARVATPARPRSRSRPASRRRGRRPAGAGAGGWARRGPCPLLDPHAERLLWLSAGGAAELEPPRSVVRQGRVPRGDCSAPAVGLVPLRGRRGATGRRMVATSSWPKRPSSTAPGERPPHRPRRGWRFSLSPPYSCRRRG